MAQSKASGKTMDEMLEIAEAPEKEAKAAADQARIVELQAEIRGLQASCDDARNYADQNKPTDEAQKLLDQATQIREELSETKQEILCLSRNASLLIGFASNKGGVALDGFTQARGARVTSQDAIERPEDYLAKLGTALDKIRPAAGNGQAADLYAKLQAEKNPMAKALFYRQHRRELRAHGFPNEETTEGAE